MTIEETIAELSTPEAIVKRMRDDAQKFGEVAEAVSLNRTAIAMIVSRVSKIPVSEGAAMGFVRIMFDVLSEFANDMAEAADAAASGEMTPRVVDVGIIGPNGETDNGTKH